MKPPTFRRLPRHLGPLPRGIRLEGQAVAAGTTDRRALSRRRRHVLRAERGGGPAENARLTVEADGQILLGIGSSSLGQGIETTFTQVTADALGLPFECIRVLHGSTGLVSDSSGSYHSRTAIIGGSAILDAADKLRPLIREAGARWLGCAPQDVELRDGCIVAAGDRTVALADLGARAIATAVRSPSKAPSPRARTPGRTARKPRMSRSIRELATWRSWIVSWSRTSAA